MTHPLQANPKTWLIVTADGRFRVYRLFRRLVRRLFGYDNNTMWRIIQSFGTEAEDPDAVRAGGGNNGSGGGSEPQSDDEHGVDERLRGSSRRLDSLGSVSSMDGMDGELDRSSDSPDLLCRSSLEDQLGEDQLGAGVAQDEADGWPSSDSDGVRSQSRTS